MQNIPSEVTLFRNVNIFDGQNEKLLMGHDVLVVENKIKKIDKGIKIADTYQLDVKTGGLKEMGGGSAHDFQGSGNKVVYLWDTLNLANRGEVHVFHIC